jgi:hypothetical protein
MNSTEEFSSTLVEERKRKEGEASEREKDRHRQDREDKSRDHHHHHRSSGHKKHSSSSTSSSSKKHKDVKPVIVEDNPWGSDAEDWEAESHGYDAGYDPTEKLEKDIVLYNPRGLSKSERKAFRHEQKQRARQKSSSPEIIETVDVKPFSRLDVNETAAAYQSDYRPGGLGNSRRGSAATVVSTSKAPSSIPPPVVKPEPVQWKNEEREDGECSEEEFFGEDPFA